jgi:hypothetical protein
VEGRGGKDKQRSKPTTNRQALKKNLNEEKKGQETECESEGGTGKRGYDILIEIEGNVSTRLQALSSEFLQFDRQLKQVNVKNVIAQNWCRTSRAAPLRHK